MMHRIFNIALLTLTVASGLLFIGPVIESHDLHNEEQAKRAFRRDLQAAEFCRQMHGEAGYEWKDDGELVCIPRHGKKTVQQDFQ
jgi:hypothetical protein